MPDEKKSEPKQEPQPGYPEGYEVKTEMVSKEYVAPDGHVVVSKKDIENRV